MEMNVAKIKNFCVVMVLLGVSHFSFAQDDTHIYNKAACLLNNNDNLGACYLNMTGEDLSGQGVNIIEQARFTDGSRTSSTILLRNFPLYTYTVIEQSTSQMKRNHITQLHYGLMRLGKINPMPMPTCDIKLSRSNSLPIKVIQKSGNRYYCDA